MAALAWLGIPICATLLAVLWATWANRPAGPADVHESVEHHQRFKDALSREPGRGRGTGLDRLRGSRERMGRARRSRVRGKRSS